MFRALFAASLFATTVSVVHAETFQGMVLKPQFTKSNGMSCGRTSGAGKGVPCTVADCYSKKTAEFSNWKQYEDAFLSDELDRSGLVNATNFTELCPAYSSFSNAERKLFWLDFLKMIAGFESDFQILGAYDDWIGGKPNTSRGFFQVGVADCAPYLPDVTQCQVHDPRTHGQCVLGIMKTLVTKRSGSTLDRLAAHWGSLRSAKQNAVGGRRAQIARAFSKHLACKKGATPRAPYDRLKKGMWPEDSWAEATILPSWKPRDLQACAKDQKVTANANQCKRVKIWERYAAIDAASSVVKDITPPKPVATPPVPGQK